MRMVAKSTYAGIIGDIVRDDRECTYCKQTIFVGSSAITAAVFCCAHAADGITALLLTAGVAYTVDSLDNPQRYVISVNRWANRAALGAR